MTFEQVRKEWDAALAELHSAVEAHAEAAQAASFARARETDALNRLNTAQRAMDDLDTKMRESMPRDSDWKRRKTQTA